MGALLNVMFSAYGIAILFAFVLLVGSIVYTVRSLNELKMSHKVAKVTGNKTQQLLDQVASIRAAQPDRLNETISRMPTLDRTQLLLRQAGITLNVRTYTMVPLFLGGLGSLVIDTPIVVPAVEPIVFVLGLHLFFNMALLPALGARRRSRIIRQMPEAIDFVARSLGVGQALESGIRQAIPSLENPLRKELEILPRLLDMGLPLSETLDVVAQEIDTSEFDFFVAACKVQIESGGNLAETLHSLADMIRNRHQLKMKVAAMSAEGRISAVFLTCMPLLMLAYLDHEKPEYVAMFFTTPIGHVMLGSVFVLLTIGGLLCWWIARIRI